MPNRLVREGFLDSESIDKLDWFAECVFHRLLIVSDDAGRFDGRARVIASRCFPLKDSIRAKDVEGHLLTLEKVGLVMRYEFEGMPFLQILKVQRYGKSTTSKYPWTDGAFEFSFVKKSTRDGVKEFVNTSNPIQTPSVSHRDESLPGDDSSQPHPTGKPRIPTDTGTDTGTDTDTHKAGKGKTALECRLFDRFCEITGKSLALNDHRKRLVKRSLDECKWDMEGAELAIDRKNREWKDDAAMKRHLMPETIFAPSKWLKYFETRNDEIQKNENNGKAGGFRRDNLDRNKGTFNEGKAAKYGEIS